MRRTRNLILGLTLLILFVTGAVYGQGGTSNKAKPNGRATGNGNAHPAAPAIKLSLPNRKDSVKFLIIGDTGTGTAKQHDLAEIMLRSRASFPYEFVLMMGDNMYGGEKPADFKNKFEDVYRPIMAQNVKFYASLGNHDEPAQRFYEFFNMEGKEYYRFTRANAAFYALNSNYMDKKQVKWLEDELAKDTSEWKIAFFHHPPYSSGGKHGSDTQLREVLEPIFVKYGMNVALTGHEHFYERIKPQKGVYYFISGAGGKLRSGDVKDKSPLTEKAFDKDMSFMLAEIVNNQLFFQVISRTGETVDSGILVSKKKQ
ncbi:MAG TPA: metallophosphoesterase [Pyrinomonadaceae bacterium]|nr:metallophosphoesterase [Pyrinomonadaceae bacterium]